MKCKICKKNLCACNYRSDPRLSPRNFVVTMDTYKSITEKTFSMAPECERSYPREFPVNRKNFLPFDEYISRRKNLRECSTCSKTHSGFHQDRAFNYQQVSSFCCCAVLIKFFVRFHWMNFVAMKRFDDIDLHNCLWMGGWPGILGYFKVLPFFAF